MLENVQHNPLTGSCREERPVMMCHNPRLDLPEMKRIRRYSTYLRNLRLSTINRLHAVYAKKAHQI